jgi:AcrR family transcriptional regulator
VTAERSEGGIGPDFDFGPLPAGHHGLSPEQVAESQRERLLAAVVRAVAEKGYASTTIGDVVAAASVSTRTFYENFESKEACFLAALDAIADHLRDLVTREVGEADGWPNQVVAALRAVLRFFEDEPDLARACVLEPVAASPAVVAEFRRVTGAAVPLLAVGRAQPTAPASLPESTEETLLGGLIVLLSRSIVIGDPLEPLLADLAEFLLAPYLGAAAARRLATRTPA